MSSAWLLPAGQFSSEVHEPLERDICNGPCHHVPHGHVSTSFSRISFNVGADLSFSCAVECSNILFLGEREPRGSEFEGEVGGSIAPTRTYKSWFPTWIISLVRKRLLWPVIARWKKYLSQLQTKVFFHGSVGQRLY